MSTVEKKQFSARSTEYIPLDIFDQMVSNLAAIAAGPTGEQLNRVAASLAREGFSAEESSLERAKLAFKGFFSSLQRKNLVILEYYQILSDVVLADDPRLSVVAARRKTAEEELRSLVCWFDEAGIEIRPKNDERKILPLLKRKQRNGQFLTSEEEPADSSNHAMEGIRSAYHKYENWEYDFRERAAKKLKNAFEGARSYLLPFWKKKDEETFATDGIAIKMGSLSEWFYGIKADMLTVGSGIKSGLVGYAQENLESMKLAGQTGKAVLGGMVGKYAAEVVVDFCKKGFQKLPRREKTVWDYYYESPLIKLHRFAKRTSVQTGERLKSISKSTSQYILEGRKSLFNLVRQAGLGVYESRKLPLKASKALLRDVRESGERAVNISQGVTKSADLLRKYGQIYAVSKWKEAGLSDVDIKRRMKVLQVVGAVSVKKLETAAVLSGTKAYEVLTFLARDPRGRILLGSVALLLFLINNHEVISSNLHNLFQDAGITNFPVTEAAAAHMPINEAVSIPDVSATSLAVGQDHLVNHASVIASVPDHSVVNVDSVTTNVHDSHVSVSVYSAAPSEVLQSPDALAGKMLSQVHAGQALEPQLREFAKQMPGDPNDNYFHLLQSSFDKFSSSFEKTAREIINAPKGTYEDVYLKAAKEQLEAIKQIKQNSLDPNTNDGFGTFMRALRFWWR